MTYVTYVKINFQDPIKKKEALSLPGGLIYLCLNLPSRHRT